MSTHALPRCAEVAALLQSTSIQSMNLKPKLRFLAMHGGNCKATAWSDTQKPKGENNVTGKNLRTYTEVRAIDHPVPSELTKPGYKHGSMHGLQTS
jgi:hypothetical protein